MTEKYTRFITLLKSMFELDKSDLDFGIYRIINIRRQEITDFLDNKLHEKITTALSSAAVDDNIVKSRIAEIEKICADVGVSPSDSPKFKDEYAQLKSQLTAGANITELETDVYSALYNFFNRYYDEGDFISKRRYKEGVYAIPYEGEEVKLHWANHDQYYIKSSENFKDYSFVTRDNQTVHFSLVDATTETANNKESEKRVFMLLEDDFIEISENELTFKFVYDIPQDKKRKYNEENIKRMEEAIYKLQPWRNNLMMDVSTEKKKPKSFLSKHYNTYVAKNSFDYFIHKDLKGFLSRELDFFIKSEVMHLDDIDTDNEVRVGAYLSKVKAIKRVGKDIIDFLAQIEDFQKKLWLKKKFIVETNWCITLDKIDEKFYQEIASNEAQVDEWVKMYAIDEIDGNLTTPAFAMPLSVEFLKANKHLIVDTKHFSIEFKDKLLASIDNLDEQTNGFMVHSENFQALNLLQEKYKDKLSGVYIDPPYNTEGMEIIYKNGYKDSSWISLLAERLNLTPNLLGKNAPWCVLIDDAEYANLYKLMQQVLNGYQIRPVIIEYNHRGRVKSNFAYTHEYAVWAIPSGKDVITRKSEISDDIKRNLRRTGTDSTRVSSPSMYYGIKVNQDTLEIIGVTDALAIGEPTPTNDIKDGIVTIYPIDDNGIERRWYYGKDRIMDDVRDGTVWAKIIKNKIQIHYHQDGKPKYRKTLLNGPLMDSSTYGSELLNDLFGLGYSEFSFPKSINAVMECIESMSYATGGRFLDFFAGSGTTGHAVINLNRRDDGSRKYVLVEMGEYFNTATLPRIKKVVYSADWKNGKPQSHTSGVSQIIKYVRLESYEDTLQNIRLDDETHGLASLFGEDYILNYMFNTEAESSLLNTDLFKAPFDYKLKITEKNESKVKNIDLCETFNYLIGLNVLSQSEVTRFAVSGKDKDSYEGAVNLTLDKDGKYGFKVYEGKLRTGEKTLVIWRTLTDDLLADNAALDAFFVEKYIKPADIEFDLIYVNGDNNIENLRKDNEAWKINLIEIEMKRRMFEGV